jgi:hypothetical protein
VIFNSVPSGSILKVIPASRVAPILVDGSGLRVRGTGRAPYLSLPVVTAFVFLLLLLGGLTSEMGNGSIPDHPAYMPSGSPCRSRWVSSPGVPTGRQALRARHVPLTPVAPRMAAPGRDGNASAACGEMAA